MPQTLFHAHLMYTESLYFLSHLDQIEVRSYVQRRIF